MWACSTGRSPEHDCEGGGDCTLRGRVATQSTKGDCGTGDCLGMSVAVYGYDVRAFLSVSAQPQPLSLLLAPLHHPSLDPCAPRRAPRTWLSCLDTWQPAAPRRTWRAESSHFPGRFKPDRACFCETSELAFNLNEINSVTCSLLISICQSLSLEGPQGPSRCPGPSRSRPHAAPTARAAAGSAQALPLRCAGIFPGI